MHASRSAVLAVAVLALAAGCSDKKKSSGGGASGYITLTASPGTMVANGTKSITVAISNTTGSAATVSTDKGTLTYSGTTATSVSVSAASANITLACDFTAGTNGCTANTAGTIHVNANAGAMSGSAVVSLVTLDTACSASCIADSGCISRSCTGGTGYTCQGTWPTLSCAASTGGGGGAAGGTGALGSVIPGDPPYQAPVLGTSGSGYQEFGWVQVQVLDDTGKPFADGTTVHFEHKKLGGSTLAAPTVACTVPSSNCVAHDSTVTGGNGLASVWLYAGTAAGTLQVTATVTAGGITRTLALPTVAVIGARASGTNFSVMCSQLNIPALAQHDCGVSWVDAPFNCVALAKDRYNNLLGTESQVIFASEASGVGQVALTPAYDPAKDNLNQPDLGHAVQLFQTLGAGLPFDVAPQTGEPSVSHGLDGCGTRTHNPRDGVVTIIAMIDGEEGFFDANGNGKYDSGEPFTDQGEPYIDQNDDGVWNTGEWFLDVNGNGVYDGPNGVWDATAKIWAQTVVLYTGEPMPRFGTVAGGAPFLGVRVADPLGTVPVGGDYGRACVPSAAPTNFSVTAGTVPTVDYAWGLASDYNLNLLSEQASYGAEVSTGGIAVDRRGPQNYADAFGFFYQFWPCEQAGAGACASQCRATGGNIPCVMKPKITSFSCGPTVELMAIGGAIADGALLDQITWSVELPYKLYSNNNRSVLVESSWFGFNL